MLISLHLPACSCPCPPYLQANEILHHKLTLNGYLAEFTGQGMETITADTDRDFFMSAQEAVSGGAEGASTARRE
jgi:ATP-dependent Clp protease protease subunit